MGRPREFDVDDALQTAMEIFWRKGYEGTSVTDLTDGMGITKPSLYGFFGNKEELFRKALERYEQTKLCFFVRALAEPRARDVAEKILKGFADMQTDGSNPGGCMAVSGALACSEAAADVQKSLIESRQKTERLLTERFERAHTDGDLPADQDPAELAQYIMTISQGTAVQAASGADRDALYRVIETSLKCWPADPAPL
ncbi:TetR/AcrR family transcriptional regulator [Pararhizobium sp.]|uniref:TetR/AcrR family transcriptional regulator n=1 Tax=Pararhizobium sp. TaxID=1977563 RepID=UPI002720D291|nr:TetR/AcrR family transcriptional regulator [Pararhizobium sp.]MDO9418088.1 TetR/AcrR family transcriptional regulator [Pararhizobium sp.]